MTLVKSKQEIEAMRQGGRMLASVLLHVKQNTKSGATTKDLALLAQTELRSLGGEPSFLGYQGFPDVLCVSVNDEIVHGIPRTTKVLNDGDIVSIDFGVTYKGLVTDSAISYIVGGSADKLTMDLLNTTEESMLAGISVLKDSIRVGDISAAIQKVINKKNYGIVRDLVGHGVGHSLHELPNIPNYGRAGTGPILKSGMTVAIEPMVALGDYRVQMDSDNWTVKTSDGSLSAHYEHTVLITENSFEILTDRSSI